MNNAAERCGEVKSKASSVGGGDRAWRRRIIGDDQRRVLHSLVLPVIGRESSGDGGGGTEDEAEADRKQTSKAHPPTSQHGLASAVCGLGLRLIGLPSLRAELNINCEP